MKNNNSLFEKFLQYYNDNDVGVKSPAIVP